MSTELEAAMKKSHEGMELALEATVNRLTNHLSDVSARLSSMESARAIAEAAIKELNWTSRCLHEALAQLGYDSTGKAMMANEPTEDA